MSPAAANKALRALLLVTISASVTHGFGFGGSTGPLYTSSDRGITVLNVNNFSQIVHNSSTAWMVEFYSSWCGHCIRFAPVFKELGQNVEDWKSIMRLGAIDCAQDENVATCRNYEIMGYPSLKFFPPMASGKDLGELRESMGKDIGLMMADMTKYIDKLSANASFSAFWKKSAWPDFSVMDQPLDDELGTNLHKATNVILIVEPSDSDLGHYAMMELHTLLGHKGTVVIRRGLNVEGGPLADLIRPVSRQPFVVLSLEKGSQGKKVIYETADSTSGSWLDLRKALHSYATKTGSSTRDQTNAEELSDGSVEVAITREEDIKRRRYTAYMSDLENAVLYSLTHEVGSRSSIVGHSLVALQNYMAVLSAHFPGRPDTMAFIHQLRNWVAKHDDAIKGEDLIAEANDIRASVGSFTDTPNGAWIGCKGSKPFYGGYPCSLWTLWHVLTVNQKSEEQPPHKVLDAMIGYVKHFFGCEDCVRHFLQFAEDGEAIEKEVTNKSSSILWLWKAHNKANVRLSGDVTDDKAFPKEVFPNRQHCSDCYNSRLVGNLWAEFDLEKVVAFLTELYREENLNYLGLRFKSSAKLNSNNHALANYYPKSADKVEPDFHNNYGKAANGSGLFWGPMDFSLCFSIYLLSAVILIFAYFKFVAKRKLLPCSGLVSGLFSSTQQQRSRNGLYNVV